MKLLSLTLAIFCAILFSGCPYSSEIALSNEAMKPADNLIGTWELSGSSGEKVEIKAGKDHFLTITKTEPAYDGGEPTVTTYTGHLTDVEGSLFLNLKESADYSSYYFYKIVKESEYKLTVYSVTPNIREKFTNPSEMKKFFAANMKNSYFYETGEQTYYKVK